tara:strand:+ start:17 stop:244 length:228 start_codon:yes stop_codon:yes gene_type:complete
MVMTTKTTKDKTMLKNNITKINKVIVSLRKLQLSSEFRKALNNNFPITNNGNIELEKFYNNFNLVVNMLDRIKKQ